MFNFTNKVSFCLYCYWYQSCYQFYLSIYSIYLVKNSLPLLFEFFLKYQMSRVLNYLFFIHCISSFLPLFVLFLSFYFLPSLFKPFTSCTFAFLFFLPSIFLVFLVPYDSSSSFLPFLQKRTFDFSFESVFNEFIICCNIPVHQL